MGGILLQLVPLYCCEYYGKIIETTVTLEEAFLEIEIIQKIHLGQRIDRLIDDIELLLGKCLGSSHRDFRLIRTEKTLTMGTIKTSLVKLHDFDRSGSAFHCYLILYITCANLLRAPL